MCNVLQKPLRRIEIVDVRSGTEHQPAGSKAVIQEVVRESTQHSSPLSTSPTAKMIKIEEIAEVSSQSRDPLVELLHIKYTTKQSTLCVPKILKCNNLSIEQNIKYNFFNPMQ